MSDMDRFERAKLVIRKYMLSTNEPVDPEDVELAVWIVSQAKERLILHEKEVKEWTMLIKQAKDQGMSKSEVREFFTSNS
jgi:hypothetical protein